MKLASFHIKSLSLDEELDSTAHLEKPSRLFNSLSTVEKKSENIIAKQVQGTLVSAPPKPSMVVGHSSIDTTLIYAERDETKMIELAMKCG